MAVVQMNATPAALKDLLLAGGAVTDPTVLAAFGRVERHRFVEQYDPMLAYRNEPLRIFREDGSLLTIASQPSAIGMLLQALALSPGARVLEFGTGTGYQASLLAELVGSAGRVVTLDVEEEVTSTASRRMRALGYHQVRVVTADASMPLPDEVMEEGPFDALVFGCTAAAFLPHWLDVMSPGGAVAGPFALGSFGFQSMMLFRRSGACLAGRLLGTGQYMPMLGRGGPPALVPVQQGLSVACESPLDAWPLLAVGVSSRLASPHRLPKTMLALASLLYWCGVASVQPLYVLAEHPDAYADRFGPEQRGWRGDVARGGAALLNVEARPGDETANVKIVSFGSGQIASRMEHVVDAFFEAGCPEPKLVEIQLMPGIALEERPHQVLRSWGSIRIEHLKES